ncbi:lipopolysaccharide biosynthesis protein [Amphibacillus sediminis]|uniref:lipopolysaccharide biosynthesis protein n=1 Tax=Amphibacillus sediminis TaxID=360185 RepID=UPI00082BD13C|nr:oligosaccharide flippase family protein [Amphibacillus sediminis]
MINKIKKSKFFKNSILYTIGGMMTPLIGFIMLPIYTNYLPPSEYGIMTTVQSLVGMFQIFLLLSLNGAVTRFYYDFLDNKTEQRKYLGTIYIFVFLFATAISILMLILHQFIGGVLFSNIPVKPYYFYMIGLSWLNALLALPLALLRAQEKAGLFVAINIIKALIIMSLTMYFIIVKGLGAISALASQSIILSLTVIILLIYSLKYISLKISILFIKNSLWFSLPLLPHVASGWIISSSDRVILEKFVSLDKLGVYSLAVQVSMVLSLFYTSVNNALVPRYTSLRKENKNIESQKLLKSFYYIVIIFGAISIPIAMLGTKLLSSDSYNYALWLIPFLIVGHILKGIYYIPVAKLFYNKSTRAIATSSSIAAVVNILVNLTLIPFIGVPGAVVSTIIAEIIRTLLIYKASLKTESI